MDLIKAYKDQSHSSSSDDEPSTSNYTAPTSPQPSTSYSTHDTTVQSNKVSSFEPIERIPLDRLMMASAAIASAKKPSKRKKVKQATFQPAVWIGDIGRELRDCLGKLKRARLWIEHSLQCFCCCFTFFFLALVFQAAYIPYKNIPYLILWIIL